MSGTTGAAGAARCLANALTIAGLGLAAGACAQLGPTPMQLSAAQTLAAESADPAADNRSELQKATEYWGKVYAKDPKDAQAGLNYARNLKALGEKRQALAVLQQVSTFHPGHRGINGEYGRLALEFDHVSLASKLLEHADDPTRPDWQVISARGTALAKQGRYREAIPFYERALALAPDRPSILNNLALAHAMEGNPEKAEALLRKAAEGEGAGAQVSQNLALVLSLQGKYDEAKLTAARELPADRAAANVEYVRRIVNVEPKALTTAAIAKARKSEAKAEPADGPGAAPGWAAKVAGGEAERRR